MGENDNENKNNLRGNNYVQLQHFAFQLFSTLWSSKIYNILNFYIVLDTLILTTVRTIHLNWN
jgi:hypothetical protein